MSGRFRQRPEPPAPRGGPSAGPRTCPDCATDQALIEVFLRAGDEDVSFAICSNCEWRRWGSGGSEVAREDALAAVAADLEAHADRRNRRYVSRDPEPVWPAQPGAPEGARQGSFGSPG
jgi:hypothetical protein